MSPESQFTPRSITEPQAPRSIEETANYEGNASELLFSRLANPVIREQLVDLICRGELAAAGETYMQVDETSEDFSIVEKTYVPRTREQVIAELKETVATTELFTPIVFSDEQPNAMNMPIGDWKLFGKNLTTAQKSITEAHEKGHVIRPFRDYSNYYRDHFRQGFDIERVVFTQEEIDELRHQSSGEPAEDPEEEREIYIEGLFCAPEIAERMSQLKNYFGMAGAETFTREHLAYAREHYVADTGLDNLMTRLLEAITPETEEKFLEVMNTSGI